MEMRFNLLDEPWIRVLTDEMETKEVSLKELFRDAHHYRRIAGEMPTQDFAVLRVLLAIAITVFYRYDANGNEDEFDEDSLPEDVLKRWKEYWDKEQFNIDVFSDYLEKYRDRFWLFHPKTPFFQTAELAKLKKIGTDYPFISVMGNIKESNNKATKHHFSVTDGNALNELSLGEVTRWLINLNAFGVNVKTKNLDGKNVPTGVGRLGQLGIIYIHGNNVFQSIMLNLKVLRDNGGIWGKSRPVWEKNPTYEPGIKISPPDNLPEIYTIQSRRMLLTTDENSGQITGVRVTGGEFYETTEDFNEPMTIWRGDTDKKTGITTYKPRLHDISRFSWQEFPDIIPQEESGGHTSGIVTWAALLRKCRLIDKKKNITFITTGITYDSSMKYTLVNCLYDNIRFSGELLEDKGSVWVTRIKNEITLCEEVVSKPIYFFATDISQIVYGSKDGTKDIKNRLSREFYFRLNSPFRDWLVGIDPDEDDESVIVSWRDKSRRIALQTVRDFVKDMSSEIFHSREKSVPEAVNQYEREIWKIYPSDKKEGE